MITGLRTGFLRCGIAGAILVAAASAQALTFISPMGEPFRSRAGDKAPEELWFERADANGDGKITLGEFLADAGRFFKMLDTNHDGQIGPEEIQHYEDDIAPETVGGGDGGGRRHGGVPRARQSQSDEENVTDTYLAPPSGYDAGTMGAARFSYLDLPEPVAAADVNFDRSVSPREFVDAARQRFEALDANHDGVLTRDELPHLGGGRLGPGPGGKDGGHRPRRDDGGHG